MGFDAVLKRWFAAVVLVAIGAAAYFQAAGITQLVGSSVAADDKAIAAAAAAPPAPPRVGGERARDHSTSSRAILDRNPFDSRSSRPLDGTGESGDGGSAAPEIVDLEHYQNAPPCDGLKALVVLASPDPAWSMAAMSSGGDGSAKMKRVGEDVGGKTIQIIEWNRVVLSSGGSLCQVEMYKPVALKGVPSATPAQPAAAAAAAAVAPIGGGALPGDIASKIQKVGATEFNVDRQVVDKILENQADLMRSARIVPEQENGKVVGIRLFGIRPDTLLGVLGLENGDRLQTINGFDMTSPEKALEAYARLRTADHLTVQVNRRGQNTNIDYNIK